MTDNQAELENERAHLIALTKSEGWKVMLAKWDRTIKDCSFKLRASDCENRDWYAGLVSGYERLMSWPATRISNIEKGLQNQDGA